MTEELEKSVVVDEEVRKPDFRRELEFLLNSFSKENRSNTPDHILCNFILGSLEAFDLSIIDRDKWYGFDSK